MGSLSGSISSSIVGLSVEAFIFLFNIVLNSLTVWVLSPIICSAPGDLDFVDPDSIDFSARFLVRFDRLSGNCCDVGKSALSVGVGCFGLIFS